MKVKTTREIVIEIERVRTIRKRCNTNVLFCAECGSDADFISLRKAAGLFEVDPELLNSYVLEHLCHIQSSSGETLLCLPSLLDRIQKMTTQSKSKSLSSTPLRLLPD